MWSGRLRRYAARKLDSSVQKLGTKILRVPPRQAPLAKVTGPIIFRPLLEACPFDNGEVTVLMS